MGLNRRAFLQQAGVTLTALGVSQLDLFNWANRYQQALAEPTHRKLALLVGINQYPDAVYKAITGRGAALAGCVTDVELQRELLIHRFGFQPSDIVTLTDDQATRQAIQSAFLDHLTAQARPGDVVVFHFSGYGSQVKLTDSLGTIENTLVPVDGVWPNGDRPLIQDLFEDTLWLLLRSLKTQKLTTVLDLSYGDAIVLQGNLRSRSRPTMPVGEIHPDELALQEQLLAQVNTSRQQIKAQQRSGEVPGILLAAAGNHSVAAESQWPGYSAGLFTYALTQQLWWSTPATTLKIVLGQAASRVEQRIGREQQPQLVGQKSRDPSLSTYYLMPQQAASADGAVLSVKDGGKTCNVWLGGVPAAVLEQYRPNSILQIADSDMLGSMPESSVQESADQARRPFLQIRSRTGLTAEARPCCVERDLSSQVRAGHLLWEVLRLVPREIGLTVSLDSTLERIERVDATSAFSSIAAVASVVTGDQPADCVFGKARDLAQSAPTIALPLQSGAAEDDAEVSTNHSSESAPKSGYGLFRLGQVAIPNTVAEADEAVKTAINRLAPQLKILLATKLLRLTVNEGSSRLGIRATLEMVSPQERVILQQQTTRSPNPPPDSRLTTLLTGDSQIPAVSKDSRIQYRLYNYSDRPLYFILLGLDTSGSAIALYPAPAASVASDLNPVPTPEDSVIQPGETLTIPQAAVSSEWIVNSPNGFAENYLIFSPSPLTKTFNTLAGAMRSVSNARRVSLLSRPLEVAQAVLSDLHEISLKQVQTQGFEIPADVHALHVEAWATLSFVYQIV